MTDPLLTPAARRYVARLLAAVSPLAGRLDRRFGALLRQRGFQPEQVRAFLAITPAAASPLPSLNAFLEQVEYHGRRLAKLNFQPEAARNVLRGFGGLLDEFLPGQFAPAREQLYLSTILVLNEAFYQVREAEAQAFFGLYRAESESRSLEDFMRGAVRVLTRTCRANAGRLVLSDGAPRGKLAHPLYIERGQASEKFIADAEMRGRYASYWSFPIPGAGVLQFGFNVAYPWLPREAILLEAAAERCREAIEKTRLEADIRRLGAESRHAEEDERRRIARELHDEAGQSLLALRLQLERLERVAPADMRPPLAESRGIAEHTIEELRRIVKALSPVLLERLGLRSATRQLAASFRKMHPARIVTRISGECEALARPFQEVIYRVAQESLQNIVKHSQATEVNLLLRITDMNIRLSISDNGAGFAPEAALSKPTSFGLAVMRERAARLAGNLSIRTAPGKGVKVVLELPQSSPPGTPHVKNSRFIN